VTSKTKNTWQRDELIAAFNLYCKIPFTKIHYTRPQIIELARIINRTPSSVALKLVNFARHDPKLQARNVAGMSHGSKGEKEIWNEFYGNWEELAFQSEQALARFKGLTIEESAGIEENELPQEGKMREQLIKVRVNQNFFRAAVLASYNKCCCITGIQIPELLIAGHIIPWSKDEKNRMNPANGLCLNLLHDKAFDRGLITITPDFKVRISRAFQKHKKNPAIQSFFLPCEGQPIRLPNRFLPDIAFLEYHNNEIFEKF